MTDNEVIRELEKIIQKAENRTIKGILSLVCAVIVMGDFVLYTFGEYTLPFAKTLQDIIQENRREAERQNKDDSFRYN